MKIIAETTTKDKPCDEKFLIEVTSREICRLLGFYSTSSVACPKLEVGLELNINPVYEGFYNLSHAMVDNRGLASISEDLRKLAEQLDNLKIRLKEPGEIVKDIKN